MCAVPPSQFVPPPSLSRLYAALCRLQNDVEQVQFSACELLLNPSNLETVISLASVWPRALARNHSAPPLLVGDQLMTKGTTHSTS